MKLIQYDNNTFTCTDIFQDGNVVCVVMTPTETNDDFLVNEQFVQNWFPDWPAVHPTNYGFFIENCSFQEVNIGRKYDHVEWEEVEEGVEYAETKVVNTFNFL
jgi:hypothetical protein